MWSLRNLIIYSIFAILTFVIVYYFVAEFSAIAGTLIFIIIGISALKLSDDLLLKNVNTYDEIIKHKNLPYSLYIIALAIVIASGILSATFVFWRM